MRFSLRYSLRGIKSAKTRALLVILSVLFVSVLFFASLSLPILLKNGLDDRIYQSVGDTDIMAQVYTTDVQQNLYSMRDIEIKNGEGYIEENLDYAIGTLIMSGRYVNIRGNMIVVTPIATTYDDVLTLNASIEFVGDAPDSLDNNRVIIGEDLAKDNNVNINDTITIRVNKVDYQFIVAGICKNKGILSNSGSPVVLLNKEFVKQKIIGSIYTSALFNFAVFKVKPGVDKQKVVEDLYATYPNFSVRLVYSEAENAQVMSTTNYIYNICSSIGILFSMFVIFLTMNLIFSRRVQEFSRLRTMGATTKQLFMACLFESMLYGFIGGSGGSLLALALYEILKTIKFSLNIFHGLTAFNFILPILFGMFISVVSGLIPAIKTARTSVRQQMIKTHAVGKKTKIASMIVAVLLVAIEIVMALLPIGQAPIFQIIGFFLVLIASVYLIPIILLSLIKLIAKIPKFRKFSTVYLNKNIHSPSVNMVTRIICFGLAFMMVLSMAISTVQNFAYVYCYDSQNNAYISGKDEYTDEMIAKVLALDGVYDAFETAKFKYIKFEGNDRVVYESQSLKPEDFERLYSDVLIDREQTIQNFISNENAIVLNISYKYLENLNVGDTVKIVLNEKFTYEYQVAGFFDSTEKAYNSVVFTLEKSKAIYQEVGGSYRLGLRIEPSKFRSIESALYGKGIISSSDEVGSFATTSAKSFKTLTFPVNLIRGYMGLISILCITCLVVGMCLAVDESAKQNRTLNLLGMNKGKYRKTLFIQMLFTSIVSIFLSLITMGTFYFNMSKILLFTNIYMTGSLNGLSIALLGVLAIILGSILSIYFTRYLFKKLKKEYQMIFERGE